MTDINSLNERYRVLKAVRQEIETVRDEVKKEEGTVKHNQYFDICISIIKKHEA